ncbi:hypothetical protein FM020_00765 [Acinetobacter tandoii]|nr:hypothetical protein FM020_00765 [Acinetobacter tandoii]
MNILIVGNGFDLSHYLPTKYDHFMDVMGAIELKDTGGLPKNLAEKSIDEWLNLLEKTFEKREDLASQPHDMAFDELFSKTRDSKFIEKTKEYYLTESVEVSAKDVLKIQYQLELNCWYQYFKNHVEEIKTWIDFEQKIEDVLVVVARCIVDLESMDHQDKIINYLNKRGQDNLKIKLKDFETLNFFNFITKNEGVMIPFNLNLNFCHGKDVKNGFSSANFINFLHTELEKFIEIFNLYLEIIVGQLIQSRMIDIDAEWSYPDKIYSFNYTNTYQRLHDAVDVEYLHGSCGEYQNIVLGVSDLEGESLKKIKAYGFTKYHQKLFKDTDYIFLNDSVSKVKMYKINLESYRKDYVNLSFQDFNAEIMRKERLDLNFYIWGHSLDVSDKDYIIDLFSLNDEIDRNVRVTVYYFDKPAKFALLNNLLAILGKDKVEQWMKNKWLVFKKNPEVKFIEAENQQIA